MLGCLRGEYITTYCIFHDQTLYPSKYDTPPFYFSGLYPNPYNQ